MNACRCETPGRGIRSDTRRVLVVVQVAITLTLLVASALAAQSFMRLAALDLGFDPANVLTLDISRLDQSRYPTYASRQRAVDDLLTATGSLPGVQSAAAVLNRPFAHGVIGWDSALLLEGQPDVDSNWLKNAFVNFEAVTPGYFQAMALVCVVDATFRRLTAPRRRSSPSSAATWPHDYGRRRIRSENAWSIRSNAQRTAARRSGAPSSASSMPPTTGRWTGGDSTSMFPSRRLRASILNTSW